MASSHQPLLFTKPSSSSSKPLHIIFLCLLAAAAGSVVLVSIWAVANNNSTPSRFTANLCGGAHDPPSCMAVVSEVLSSSTTGTTETNGLGILHVLLHSSRKRIQDAVELLTDVNRRVNDGNLTAGVEVCVELMDVSVDMILDSMVAVGNFSSAGAVSDAHTWLSGVLTNLDTCFDGLQGLARSITEPIFNDLISKARSSLAVFVAVAPSEEQDDPRQLDGGELPAWVKPYDRRLLGGRVDAVTADAVVAQDGSGKYRTVKEAVAAVPDNSNRRFVIHVKRGTYKEKVDIGKLKKNVMLVGDGMEATIITGSLNVADGTPTFNSATVAVLGSGFMAQDIWFQNTAGPQKQQAVALLLGSDQSVINRCKIDGYQDTLFAYSLRQFYRDSYITGTVDFIFGNAAAVFQNCQIVARKPPHGQPNAITAQGRLDPNQNTGISIQKCRVIPSPDLAPVKASFKTYLGRPWKQYSRTAFLESYMDSLIDPSGWAPFRGTLWLDTLSYGEYMNTGPGAGTANRVRWKGYHVLTVAAQAMPFTVARLIQGDTWLKTTGVAYIAGL